MQSASVLRRACALLLLLCLGCAAQSAPDSDLERRIERQIRASYNVPPSVGVVLGTRGPSDFPNYDLLPVTFVIGEKKQQYDFLVSKDGKTLARITKFDLTKDPNAATMSKIDLKDRPIRGNKDAKVTIVNYDDFECPFCAKMHETLTSDILKKYGDRVRIIYKDFPLTEIHPWAKHAAIDANCLAAQSNEAYWGFADYMHEHQREISNGAPTLQDQYAVLDHATLEQAEKFSVQKAPVQACIKEQSAKSVEASMAEATALGVDATPTLFINGQKVDGVVPPDQLHELIDSALKNANSSSSANTASNVPPSK